MAVRWVQKDVADLGPLQTISVTLATPQETTLAPGSYLTLPNAEPATPQFSYTLAQSDMPVGGFYKLQPILSFAGFCTSGTGSISYRYERVRSGTTLSAGNGTASAPGANNYFTVQVAGTSATLLTAVVGDTVQLKLWAAAGVVADLRWYSLSVMPTRWTPHESGTRTYTDIGITMTNKPTFTGGVTPTSGASNGWFYQPWTTSDSIIGAGAGSLTMTTWRIGESQNFGLGRHNLELNTLRATASATAAWPSYNLFVVPSQVTYRLTSL